MKKEDWTKLKADTLKGINWMRVKSAHKNLGITWEFEDGIIGYPTVADLKNHVSGLIDWCINEKKMIVETETWLVSVVQNPAAINVWFILEYSGAIYIEEDKREIEEKIQQCIEKEDYETAAKLRDKLKKLF